MIRKIISGGQSGVEQSALDVAIKLGIEHGGWVSSRHLTEDETLLEKYQLQEMEQTNYARVTEQNVLDADATLILFQGEITGGCAISRRLAEKHKRLLLTIDLNAMAAFQAAQKIEPWITAHNIKILNVTGSKTGEGPDIYQLTLEILETALQLVFIDRSRYHPLAPFEDAAAAEDEDTPTEKLAELFEIPKNVEEAVDILLSRLSFKEKTRLANIPKEKLMGMTPSLRVYIKNEFRLWDDDEDLVKSYLSPDGSIGDASSVIVAELWKKLQKSDKVLRVVK
jgi:hypothetical protein